jgi:hypothetical protein
MVLKKPRQDQSPTSFKVKEMLVLSALSPQAAEKFVLRQCNWPLLRFGTLEAPIIVRRGQGLDRLPIELASRADAHQIGLGRLP